MMPKLIPSGLRSALHPSLCLAALVLAPAAAAAQTLEDLAPALSGELPFGVPRDDGPAYVAAQGAAIFHAGVSEPSLGSVAEVLYVTACDLAGQELFRFREDSARTIPFQLWAPPAGSTAFVASVRDQQQVELLAFRADGSRPFEYGAPLVKSALIFPPVFVHGDQAGSRVFVAFQENSALGRLRSIDPGTGALRWEIPLPSGAELAGLASDSAGDRVFVMTEFGQSGFNDRVLIAVDGATGTQLWNLSVAAQIGLTFTQALLASSTGSAVYLASGASPLTSRVAAFSGADGSPLWTANVPGIAKALAREEVDDSLLVLADVLWSGPYAAQLTSLRLNTGFKKWSTALALDNGIAGPFRHYGLLVDEAAQAIHLVHPGTVPGTSALSRLSLLGGALESSLQLPLGATSAAVRVPLASTGPGGPLAWLYGQDDPIQKGQFRVSLRDPASQVELAAHTGGFSIGQARPLGLALPAGGPRGFLSAREGSSGPRRIAAFDRQTGTPQWSTQIGGSWLNGDPVQAGRRLLARSDGSMVYTVEDPEEFEHDARLVALAAADGTQLWGLDLGSAFRILDLELVEAAGQPQRLLVQEEGQNSFLGRSRMVGIEPLTGAVAWAAEWPTSGSVVTFAGALAVSPTGQTVAGYAAPILGGQVTLLHRKVVDGELLYAKTLSSADFGALPPVGNLSASDVCFSPDGTKLFLLVRGGGGLAGEPSFGLAIFDAATGALLAARVVGTAPGAAPSTAAGFLFCDQSGSAVVAILERQPAAVRLAGLSTVDGALLWQVDRPGRLLDAVADAAGRQAIVAFGEASGEVRAIQGFDLRTGAAMDSYEFDAPELAGAALAVEGMRRYALVGDRNIGAAAAARIRGFDPTALQSGPSQVSLAAPEPIVLQLDRPSSASGSLYLVLGSASGTGPGVPLAPGVVLFLQPDAYTSLWLAGPTAPPFVNGLGLLDSAGDGRAGIVLPAGLNPALAGLLLRHAFVEFSGPGADLFASPTSSLRLVP